MAASYSLYELNEYIKRVMALNFQEAIWVKCEISQASLSRGSVYLNIVELEEQTEEIKAQASAVIWPRSYIFLKNKLGELLPFILETGSEILVKVKVDFHERYGMKLVVEDIDPSYTLGQAEMVRQKIIERLRKENLLDLNDNRVMPDVIQSVAVISSETAAGYQDFVHQLEDNSYGYDIRSQLFHCAMQGRNVEQDVVAAFREIQENGYHYDCIIIIRGGGSKLDLAGFDNYNIGHAIATCRLPVIVGIGHEIDTTVTDLAAHTSLKTPTAVADYIIERNVNYESDILNLGYQLQQLTQQAVQTENNEIDHLQHYLQQAYRDTIQSEYVSLSHSQSHIQSQSKNLLSMWNQYIRSTEDLIKVVDPVRTLKRGFSIIKQDGKSINSIADLSDKKAIEVVMKDGSAKFVKTEK